MPIMVPFHAAFCVQEMAYSMNFPPEELLSYGTVKHLSPFQALSESVMKKT